MKKNLAFTEITDMTSILNLYVSEYEHKPVHRKNNTFL